MTQTFEILNHMIRILIAGGSGLLGMRLSKILSENGHEVFHLSRQPDSNTPYKTLAWNPSAGEIDESCLPEIDFIINLAGAGIAERLWTDSRKKLIISSRVDSTMLFKKLIADGKMPKLKAYISASAIGFYGNRGEELLFEHIEPGSSGFLPEVVKAWEDSILQIKETGVRTVAFRIGIVLSTKGGALPKMMLPVKLLTAPVFGAGNQWVSWIHIDDLCRMITMAVENPSLSGIYNAVSPNPARNKDLMKAIKQVQNLPAILVSIPEWLLRTIMGALADTVLDSTQVSSALIQNKGFEFKFPELIPALDDLKRRRI